jgi:hypothetical protein
VPRISAFYGIVIEMYFGDHPPPHFHARYGGDVGAQGCRERELRDHRHGSRAANGRWTSLQ